MAERGCVLMVGGLGCAEYDRALERRGLDWVTLTLPELVARVEPPAGAVAVEAVDFGRPLRVFHRILELSRRHRFRGIVPVIDFGMEVAVLAASRLGLPTLPLRVVRNTRDKLRMRRVLERAGLDRLRYAPAGSREEAEAFFDRVGGPVIVKPASSMGSEGVFRVDERAGLAAAVAAANAVRGSGLAIVEEYVEGPEVSLEAATVDGRFIPIALTDKCTNENFIEVGHQQPSAHPPAIRQELFTYASQALTALGVDQAVSHSEFRLGARGPVLIETHTRMGGGSIHRLTERTTGVDLADLMVALALGERPAPVPQPTGLAAAVRLLVAGPGRVRTVEAPPPGDGVEEVDIWVRAGDEVGPCRSSTDRLGCALAVGRTPAAAAATAERYLDRIRIAWGADLEPGVAARGAGAGG